MWMRYFGARKTAWIVKSWMQLVSSRQVSSNIITTRTLLLGPHMKVVSTMSAGVNHIDVDELGRRGIKFGHTPGVLDNTVAETAVLLALAASRRLYQGRLKIERLVNKNKNLRFLLTKRKQKKEPDDY